MKKLNGFCKRHLSEVVFAVWAILVAGIFAYWFNNNPVIKACVVMGSIAFVGNIFLSWLLSFRVTDVVDREKLGWTALAAALLVSAVIYACALEYGMVIFYECLIGMLICWVLCLVIIRQCTALNIELEELRKADKVEYLHRMVELGRSMEVEDEEALLELPDAVELVGKYIDNSRFWRLVEAKFLKDRRFAGLWKKYFKYYSLTDAQELALFDRDDAMEIVKAYSSGSQLCERAEMKLFDMPNPEDWVKMYMSTGTFGSEKAEFRLFELPHAEELVKLYAGKYALYNESHRKAKELGWI